MDGGRESDTRITLDQYLQQRQRDTGCLVNQQQICLWLFNDQRIGRDKPDLLIFPADHALFLMRQRQQFHSMPEQGLRRIQSRCGNQYPLPALLQQVGCRDTECRGFASTAISRQYQRSPSVTCGNPLYCSHRLRLLVGSCRRPWNAFDGVSFPVLSGRQYVGFHQLVGQPANKAVGLLFQLIAEYSQAPGFRIMLVLPYLKRWNQ